MENHKKEEKKIQKRINKASYERKRSKDKERFGRKYERRKNIDDKEGRLGMFLKILIWESVLIFGENLFLNLRIRTGFYYLYINLACLSVCLSVCLYPINVKMA